jgi:hypothetical protein
MGRDKKNPKPLDVFAFQTLIKTASEVLRRHEHQLHALLHKKLTVNAENGPIFITLDIVADDDDPYATLAAQDANGEQLAQVRVEATFKLNESSASAWIADEFRRPD